MSHLTQLFTSHSEYGRHVFRFVNKTRAISEFVHGDVPQALVDELIHMVEGEGVEKLLLKDGEYMDSKEIAELLLAASEKLIANGLISEEDVARLVDLHLERWKDKWVPARTLLLALGLKPELAQKIASSTSMDNIKILSLVYDVLPIPIQKEIELAIVLQIASSREERLVSVLDCYEAVPVQLAPLVLRALQQRAESARLLQDHDTAIRFAIENTTSSYILDDLMKRDRIEPEIQIGLVSNLHGHDVETRIRSLLSKAVNPEVIDAAAQSLMILLIDDNALLGREEHLPPHELSVLVRARARSEWHLRHLAEMLSEGFENDPEQAFRIEEVQIQADIQRSYIDLIASSYSFSSTSVPVIEALMEASAPGEGPEEGAYSTEIGFSTLNSLCYNQSLTTPVVKQIIAHGVSETVLTRLASNPNLTDGALSFILDTAIETLSPQSQERVIEKLLVHSAISPSTWRRVRERGGKLLSPALQLAVVKSGKATTEEKFFHGTSLLRGALEDQTGMKVGAEILYLLLADKDIALPLSVVAEKYPELCETQHLEAVLERLQRMREIGEDTEEDIYPLSTLLVSKGYDIEAVQEKIDKLKKEGKATRRKI